MPIKGTAGLDWEPNSALGTGETGPTSDAGWGGGGWSRLLTGVIAIVDGGGWGWSRLLTAGAAVNKELRREVREIYRTSRWPARPYLRPTGGGDRPTNVHRPLGHCPVRPIASPAWQGAGPLKKDLRGPERLVPSVGRDPQSPVAAI